MQILMDSEYGFGRLSFLQHYFVFRKQEEAGIWVFFVETAAALRGKGVGYVSGPIKNLPFLLSAPLPYSVSTPATTLRGS